MIIGIDEVGLGPLAGPVTAAAVLIDKDAVYGVRDSKMVAEHKRYLLAEEIKSAAQWFCITQRTHAEINSRGITKCLRECLQELAKKAKAAYPKAEIIIDGKQDSGLLQNPKLSFLKFQIGGDRLVYQISAASLVAKAHRDLQMIEYGKQYPEYGFERHKGYPTEAHKVALEKHGLTPIHRTKTTHKTLSRQVFRREQGHVDEEHYSKERAREYVNHANSLLDVLNDWSKGFIKSMSDNLKLGLDLTPRQKFFLKKIANEARKKKTKQKRQTKQERARLKRS